MQSFNVFNLLAARVLTVVTLSYTLMEAKPLTKWRAFISTTLYKKKNTQPAPKKRERNNSIWFYGVGHHLGLKAWWCASLNWVVINIPAFPEMWLAPAGAVIRLQETFWGHVSLSFWNHCFLVFKLISVEESCRLTLGCTGFSNVVQRHQCCGFAELLLVAPRGSPTRSVKQRV